MESRRLASDAMSSHIYGMACRRVVLCNHRLAPIRETTDQMTYADYKLGKAIRALSETRAHSRDWLGSAEVYLFTRLRKDDVPQEVSTHFQEFLAEIERLQAKYRSPSMHIPAGMLTEEEVIRLMDLFADVVASWPGSGDMYA